MGVAHPCLLVFFASFLSSFFQDLGLKMGLSPFLSSSHFLSYILRACSSMLFLYFSLHSTTFILLMYSVITGAVSFQFSPCELFMSLLMISWVCTLLLHAAECADCTWTCPWC